MAAVAMRLSLVLALAFGGTHALGPSPSGLYDCALSEDIGCFSQGLTSLQGGSDAGDTACNTEVAARTVVAAVEAAQHAWRGQLAECRRIACYWRAQAVAARSSGTQICARRRRYSRDHTGDPPAMHHGESHLHVVARA